MYVLRFTDECCNLAVGNSAFLVASEMIETAAPVSNSTGKFLPLISMSTLIGLVAFSPKVNRSSSSGSLSVVSNWTNLVCSGEFLLVNPWALRALQAGAMQWRIQGGVLRVLEHPPKVQIYIKELLRYLSLCQQVLAQTII